MALSICPLFLVHFIQITDSFFVVAFIIILVVYRPFCLRDGLNKKKYLQKMSIRTISVLD